MKLHTEKVEAESDSKGLSRRYVISVRQVLSDLLGCFPDENANGHRSGERSCSCEGCINEGDK